VHSGRQTLPGLRKNPVFDFRRNVMDRSTVVDWMERYIRAWNSNNPEDIGGLFHEEGQYYTAPFREPWSGREAIVAEWLERKDEPGTFSFRYEVLAVDGGLGVVRGWTTYFQPAREYANLWLVTLDDAGRCRKFIEYWMEKK